MYELKSSFQCAMQLLESATKTANLVDVLFVKAPLILSVVTYVWVRTSHLNATVIQTSIPACQIAPRSGMGNRSRTTPYLNEFCGITYVWYVSEALHVTFTTEREN